MALSEEEQKKLYWTLLRGVAKECQNRLCRLDQRESDHDWGPVQATDHWPDLPLIPLGSAVADMKIARSFTKTCLNCGKVKTWT